MNAANKTAQMKTTQIFNFLGSVLIWSAATCRRFPTGRHVARFQSADLSAHSKLGRCHFLAAMIFAAMGQNIFAQLVDGQPRNETQISARRENFPANTNLPSLFLIGDSTVRNGRGDGGGGQWGWGDQLAPFFDTGKINVVNRALGGTTSRTFYRDFWARTLALIKPGDFVLMQFGTNGGQVNDASRARGELHGIGDETQDITNLVTKKFETVHTFGWYEIKMISEARAKGATPMICSLIPRNSWRDGKVARPGTDSAANWARDAAKAANAPFIDLNEIIARKYDELGQEKVNALFVAGAGPHTSLAGAQTNAICVVAGLKGLPENPLAKFFSEKADGIPPADLSQSAPDKTVAK
jgi:lysophospholipase L1-like esterase